jgi:hypothetical protein
MAVVAHDTRTPAEPIPRGGGEGPSKHALRSLSIMGSIQGRSAQHGAAYWPWRVPECLSDGPPSVVEPMWKVDPVLSSC